ncbi:MAG: MAPEG family protein [Xanthomonadales bacterium]|nr:MAPEG family protein [Xanthomonadales bacterium]NIN58323.1 MAPEG family protein [Xanthomonadales bacterium]NIN73668.1 MAPEG family protein [Xanthomonadales bacterium]NIO14453.1 MAPEG family protein [Xanthomonadales bacterium]NIP10716.1 MAPEG family protein [Xanthomonadales bacterium]
MTPELTYLALVTALTAVMWVPYILNTIAIRGVADAVGYPDQPAPLSPWAQKMKAAHYNAVENLVVFATLVLIAHVANVSNQATLMACMVYFWARVVHFLSYSLAIPWVRTLAFVTGFGCQATLAWQLLG